MSSILEETKFIMKKYGITANKSLGQNFLIDDEVVDGIVKSAEICDQDMVIEIGPGLGTLTSKLLENAGKVIAIELDDRMLKILKNRFDLYNNFVLIHNDVLKVDLKQLIKENIGTFKKVKIVANLPYYITTPIIMKLLEEELEIDSITVMVQKEVADRITAIPGQKNSGAISYSVYYYSIPEQVLFVPKESFIPSPEVDSAVIKLQIRNNPAVNVDNKKLFFELIKTSFMQRRKTLINGICNGKLVNSKEEGKELLHKLGLQENVRGESLSIEKFAEMANELNLK